VRFSGLLRRALDTTEVRRVRLSSIEPLDWSDELLELMAGDERICRHVHMPLQSGCDGVLKRMKRRYRVRHYEERLRRAHALMPDAAFGADVMAGFPGESDAEFLETYALIERLPLTYLHVFPYSPRPNTPAAALAPVDARVRGERTRRLIELGERKSRAFRERMRGRTLSAVALGNATAITTNYIAVELARPRERGALIHVCVGGLTRRGAVEAGALRVLPS